MVEDLADDVERRDEVRPAIADVESDRLTQLGLDRALAQGMRLNIASGSAVRFEPGQQRTVELVDYSGDRAVYGFRGLTNGHIDASVKGAV